MKTGMFKKLLAFALAVGMAVPAIPAFAAPGDVSGQTKAVDNSYAADGAMPTLHFDADPANSKSEVLHGSTGFLYGVSEIGVPSADLLSAISPKILVQKAAGGSSIRPGTVTA